MHFLNKTKSKSMGDRKIVKYLSTMGSTGRLFKITSEKKTTVLVYLTSVCYCR